MKELSIEEKAKRYDEAIKVLHKYDGANIMFSQSLKEEMFPELKESEDERIREKVIATIHLYYGEPLEDEAKEMIAWLEKQGEKGINGKNREIPNSEQNSANRVEPKFSVGDWLVHKDLVGVLICITQIQAPYYYLTNNNSFIKFGEEDNYRPWTIQDAKDGDVLFTYEYEEPKIIFILKGTPKKHYALSYYCYYNIMYPHFDDGNKPGCLAPEDSDVEPATKGQRDQLEKAMADAGYTFDFEERELKKIEQKPVNKLKTTAGNWYVCEMEVMNENMTTAFHRDEVYYCPKDGYIDVNGALFEVGTLDVFRLATKEEIPQQKQEWSEEDEKMYARIVRSYTSYEGRILYATGLSEDNRNNILEDLNEQELWLKYRLKSLRPQNTWKPSEEQMDALEDAIADVVSSIQKNVLNSLYSDLQKLR